MNDDITDTLAPKSEQLDAIDLMGKPPRIFTITKVDVRNPDSDQPVSVHLAEFDRPWKPSKNMRRVLGHPTTWGAKSSMWVGRQVELYCDPEVKFGNDKTGGVRISRMSHIDGPRTVPLLVSQGRAGWWKVDPLPQVTAASPPSPNEAKIAELTAEWHRADDSRKAEIQVEVEALRAEA